MGNAVVEKISKLDLKKRELETKKKLLKEKEKQKFAKIKSKRFVNIGKIVSRAEIDYLDDSTLLGAFLEIKKNSNSDEKIKLWKESGESFLTKEKASGEAPLSVSFSGVIGKDEKQIMKSMDFRFNKFRNEFYGYGKESDLKEKLNGFSYNIEVINK